ncbi:hypothetical protein DPMN_044041 [Dreissena polymorpha]|uniref:Uncharacterized protein n=1 Tax=Dreissena polymorpha TaxID=45954 RepID=A0A9D4D543_DREPO|nr:hypothetical protein DPMN_044041 [Dreissena polymorpha]
MKFQTRLLRRTVDELAMTIARVFSKNSLANKTTVLTNFHDDWAKIVTSRVFTRKTALPTGGHVFQRTGTTFELNQHIINFELNQDIIGTNLQTKFHEDRTINASSRVFTNKCGRMDRRRTKTGHKSLPEQSLEGGIMWEGGGVWGGGGCGCRGRGRGKRGVCNVKGGERERGYNIFKKNVWVGEKGRGGGTDKRHSPKLI